MPYLEIYELPRKGRDREQEKQAYPSMLISFRSPPK